MVNEINWTKIENDFINGISVLKLSQIYGITYNKINRYLIKNNIKTVTHYNLPKEKIQAIKNMILNGYILKDICNELQTDTSTVKIIAKENGLNIEKYKEPRDVKNKNFNDDYFETINTEHKAYFLGLIYSDGNVREHNGGYYLNLELKREDKYILEILANELNCGNKIYDRDRKTNFGNSYMSSFTSCNSKKIFDDLSKFNIIPDKSHQTKSFKNIEKYIPQNLIKHFLRGIIDGDGTISKRYTTTQNAIAVYQNEIEFCYDFDRLLKLSIGNETLKESIILNKHNGVYNLRYRRLNDVKEICDFLYNDANIYLKRKHQLAELYFKDYQESQNNDSLLLCANA